MKLVSSDARYPRRAGLTDDGEIETVLLDSARRDAERVHTLEHKEPRPRSTEVADSVEKLWNGSALAVLRGKRRRQAHGHVGAAD